jgi:hypothetical protein
MAATYNSLFHKLSATEAFRPYNMHHNVDARYRLERGKNTFCKALLDMPQFDLTINQ